jgi:hypothetical protein
MNSQYFPRTAVILFVLFTLFSFFFIPTLSHAQENSAGIGITPAVIDPAEQFKPGQVAQFSVKVSNLSSVDQVYYLSKRDIIGVQDGGVPIFAEEQSEKTGFEMTDWITLNMSEVAISAGQEVDVPFLITIPETVSPGDHFGSVVISVEPPELRSSGASIGYEVANIISIRIAGDVLEQARIREFSTSKYLYGSTNVEFLARIENEGNTLVKPTGPLEVKNMFGKRVALLTFNESQAGIFPKTASSNGLREYTVLWEDQSPGFGRYEALLSVVYGETGSMNTISSTVTFWILPMNIVLPAVIGLAVLFLVIFVAVKLYVRRSMALATSGSTRRLVRSRQQNRFPTLLVIISMLALSGLFFIILLLLFA